MKIVLMLILCSGVAKECMPAYEWPIKFPDMYEWLNFLCKLSKKTNFTWFIKTHPKMKEKYKSYQKYTRRVILNLVKDSNIKFIDPNTSHHSLIYKYNINCVY